MNDTTKDLLVKVMEKIANRKAALGLMNAEIGKATTVAQLKVILIKILQELER